MDLAVIWDSLASWFAGFSRTQGFTALVASLSGALVGALSAQAISGRRERKREVVAELRACRAAYALCFSITNHYVSLKRQHIRPIRNRYVPERQDYDDWVAKGRRRVLNSHIDFRTLSPVVVPEKALEKKIYEQISLSPKGLAAATSLFGSIAQLDHAIALRTKLAEEFHASVTTLPVVERIQRYLGVATEDGFTDERVKDNVDALVNLTDDCIWFSKTLADEIRNYANRLRSRHQWRRRLGIRKLQPLDWSPVAAEMLMPPDSKYADWSKGFPTPVPRWKIWHRAPRR